MMRGTDEIVAVAEELLSKRFGGTQSLTDIEKLGGSGTALVLRARVAPSPFLQQRSVVLKYTPATNDSMDDAALIREVVSYQFTTSLPKDVRPGPVLLAYDIDSRLLVISDSGEGETFADLLNYSGPEQRLQLLGSPSDACTQAQPTENSILTFCLPACSADTQTPLNCTKCVTPLCWSLLTMASSY